MSANPHPWLGLPTHGWLKRSVPALIFALLLASFGFVAPSTIAAPGNLALNRPVTISSSENAAYYPGSAAVDGNTTTRWASAFSDPQWIQVDLGSTQSIGRVVLNWEGAYGRAYQIQVAAAATGPYTTLYSTTTGDGGIDDLIVSGSGRYLRMYGTARATGYGYSLYEFEAYAPTGATPTPTRTNTPTQTSTARPDLVVSNIVLEMQGRTGNCVIAYTTMEIRVVVQNTGTANAGSFIVDLSGVRQTVSAGLAAGQSITLYFSLNASGQYLATADITNLVVESNESNNTRTYSSPTATPPAICTPTSVASPTRTNTPTATNVPSSCGTTNIALNKVATASSVMAGNTAPMAVDGNATGTRWESAYTDAQWLQVDLGSTQSICRVLLNWEGAYGRSYQIQVAGAATGPWTTIYTTSTGDGGVDDLTGLAGSGRYLRMNGILRGTGWGYSLWELQAYSGTGPTPTTTIIPSPTRTNTPTNTTFPLSPTRTNTPTPTATSTTCGTTNFALNKTVTASSSENVGTTPNLAVDGNTGTRWASLFSDPQWIQVDLGFSMPICRVRLNWEPAYGTAYQIQVASAAAGPWTTIYTTSTGDGGIDDLTGLAGNGRYLRMYGTARATAYGYSLWDLEVYALSSVIAPSPTPTPTPPGGVAFWGDTSTIPPATKVMTIKFLNRTNGKYPDSQVFWSFNGEVHSIAEQPYYDMPANNAGRMYFGLGVPPVAGSPTTYWDFIEYTIGPTVFHGNTTRVDAFGLKLAMRLHCADGYDVSVGENLSTFLEDRSVTFQRFVDAMPAEFKHLGQRQAPYRILEPGAGEFKPGGLYANYYTAFVDQMWANNGLTIPKPGPNGEGLGDYPDISAAIFRHVGSEPGTFSPDGRLLNQSLWSTPSTFYQALPSNHYAKFWHDTAIDALAYGFPYDDVGGYSSFISHENPQYLIVAIGW